MLSAKCTAVQLSNSSVPTYSKFTFPVYGLEPCSDPDVHPGSARELVACKLNAAAWNICQTCAEHFCICFHLKKNGSMGTKLCCSRGSAMFVCWMTFFWFHALLTLLWPRYSLRWRFYRIHYETPDVICLTCPPHLNMLCCLLPQSKRKMLRHSSLLFPLCALKRWSGAHLSELFPCFSLSHNVCRNNSGRFFTFLRPCVSFFLAFSVTHAATERGRNFGILFYTYWPSKWQIFVIHIRSKSITGFCL